MEVVRVYALHSNFLAAAGRHSIMANAKKPSVTYLHHVLVTPPLSARCCVVVLIYEINWSVGVGNDYYYN